MNNSSYLRTGVYVLVFIALLVLTHAFVLSYYIVSHQEIIDRVNHLNTHSHFHLVAVSYLLLELTVVTVVLIYVFSVLRYSVPLANFKRLMHQLGTNINIDIKNHTTLPSKLVDDSVMAVTQLQENVKQLINKRTRLLASISHDLRTPLSRLRMRVELAAEDEYKNKLLADIDEMVAMIQNILSAARDDIFHGKRETIDLNKFLQVQCQDAQFLGHAITYQDNDRALIISGYKPALRRLFNNLLDNAVKYAARAHITTSIANGMVTVHIHDDGPGIPEKELPFVFAAYYRGSDQTQQGTGLGLNTANEIVKIHGGTIQLKNDEEKGLHVFISFPAIMDDCNASRE